MKFYQVEMCYKLSLTPSSGAVHQHSIQQSDLRKQPEKIRQLVDQNARLGYKAADIARALPLQVAEGDENLLHLATYKFIANRRQALCLSTLQSRRAPENLQADVTDLLQWLENEDYNGFIYASPCQSSIIIAFVHPQQIELLKAYGHIVLMDSTHKVNS